VAIEPEYTWLNGQLAPTWVQLILNSPAIWFLARLMLVGAYIVGGFAKANDWAGAIAEQEQFGMSPPVVWAALTIAVELVGSALILTGRLVWLGAGLLGVFTLFAAFIANAFWDLPPGPERFMATNAFVEHLGLIGGLVLVAITAELRRPARAAIGA
jgi:uncharacterized membrane protein YphA (DoxX/SURF4 family)